MPKLNPTPSSMTKDANIIQMPAHPAGNQSVIELQKKPNPEMPKLNSTPSFLTKDAIVMQMPAPLPLLPSCR